MLKTIDRIDAAICLVVLLVIGCSLTFLGCLYVVAEQSQRAHASGTIVDVAPVVKLAPARGPSVVNSTAPIAKTSPAPKHRSAAPSKPGCDAECAAYLQAYRNAERANALLGEPRYDTGPYNLHNRHTL